MKKIILITQENMTNNKWQWIEVNMIGKENHYGIHCPYDSIDEALKSIKTNAKCYDWDYKIIIDK